MSDDEEVVFDFMRPSPDGRITAKQATERMAAGLKCKWCERADVKLVPLTQLRLVGYGCGSCVRGRKKAVRVTRQDARQRNTFGITLTEAKQIEDAQDGGCVCAPWTGYDGSGTRSLSTDHDHKTGQIRGRLCKHCNDLLGRVGDDPAYFRMMIEYLNNPPAQRVLGVRVVPGQGM